MKLNKRAAIEISITTVVILIIAIVVLGLAIPFIKNLFGEATDIFKGKFAEIKQILRDDLSKGELLNYKLGDEEVEVGKELGIAVGIRNTGRSESENGKICFRLEVKCERPFRKDNYCDRRNQENDIIVGGVSYSGEEPKKNWFSKIKDEFDLKESEIDIYDAKMIISDVRPDTYGFEMNLYKATNNKACSDDPEFSDQRDSLYASKSFEIDVR